MAKIERMDLRGKGGTFRFFGRDKEGNLVSVLARGDGEKYQDGDEVPKSLIESVTLPNAAQLTRWKKPSSGMISFDQLK